MAIQDSAHSRIPFEINCLILQHADIEDLRRASLIWPEMLPFIRRRTFNSVVIGHSMNHGFSPERFQRHLGSSIQNLHSVLNDTPDVHQYIHVLHLQEPKSTTGNPPPFPISRIPILPEFFGHISEMHNLEELVLERINFWMLPDAKALTRALRRASFRLHTLRLISCLMPLDILMSILHAVVDVEILELGPLRFGQFAVNGGINYEYHEDPPLVDFDDAHVWKEQRKPPETEFLCADSFQMHITSDSDHRFVDLLSSEGYSPLCDIRVLQITKMSGSQNLLRRLNKLLARMSQYLEELIIHSAEGYISTRISFTGDNSIQLKHISTFRFWMVAKSSYERNPFQHPLRVEPDPSVLELYTTTLVRISDDSRLRHVELNLVIHLLTVEQMPSVPRAVWLALDDVLTTDTLQEILESVVLNILVMPKVRCMDGSVTEQFMMDVEHWVLGECLPQTRMAYFGADQRGSISCVEVPEDCP